MAKVKRRKKRDYYKGAVHGRKVALTKAELEKANKRYWKLHKGW